MQESILILHNIRSTHNVGAMLRTADAAGIDKVYFSGYTPAPLDRFGRVREDISKTALGAEKTMVWESVIRLAPLLKRLKKDGFTLIAIEQSSQSVDYKKINLLDLSSEKNSTNRIAFLVGSEVEGITPAILKTCDIIAEIPMRGQKESLNVSVALGIALFRILDI